MTAEHYAQTMLQGIKRRVGDGHEPEEDTPTRPKKRMSYSASLKELEVAYRALSHTPIESQSLLGVLPPNETEPPSTKTNEVKQRQDKVRGLYSSILQKLQAVTSKEVPQDQPEALITAMLEENLNRCAWTYVASTAHEIETKALTMSSLCAKAGREAMGHLIGLMDERVNPRYVYH